MSQEEGKDYIGNKTTDDQEDHKYFTMIYKLNIDKIEKQKIIKKYKEGGFPFDDEKDYKEDVIRILGKDFVKQNKNNCKIIYNNKKYKLKEFLNEIDDNYNHNNKEIKLKIIGINNIIDFSDMFHGCFHLLSVSESKIENIQEYISQSNDIFNDNNSYSSLLDETKTKDTIEEIKIINYENNNLFDLFYGCISSFENISSISKNEENYNSTNIENEINCIEVSSTNKNKIKYMGRMFSGCYSLISLPDLSKWNTSNVTNMKSMFNRCNSLISLPDISKWNTSTVTNMIAMFNECNQLISLPDISKWNTSNVTNMIAMFNECNQLKSLPDISKWDTSNVTNMKAMFQQCNQLISLPDISKWNTSNVKTMNHMFFGCRSLISLPDISKWSTSNVTDMNTMFQKCNQLKSLPDISKWNTSNVTNMIAMFNRCNSLISLPDISKWNTSNVKAMNAMFQKCNQLKSLPDISK